MPKAHLAIASQSRFFNIGDGMLKKMWSHRDSGAVVERTGRVWCTPPPSRGPFCRPGSLPWSRSSSTLPPFFLQVDHILCARRNLLFHHSPPILTPAQPCLNQSDSLACRAPTVDSGIGANQKWNPS
jgi:hypothetical protein